MQSPEFLLSTSIIIMSALALVTLFESKDRKIKFIYTTYVFGALLWMLSLLFFRLIDDPTLARLLGTLLYVTPTIIPVSFLYFTYNFPSREEMGINKFLVLIFIPFVAINSLLLFSDLIIKDVVFNESHSILYFGELYFLYLIYNICLTFFSFSRLFKKYKKTDDDLVKKQTLYVLIGNNISANILFITNLILPWFGNHTYNWVGPTSAVIMVGFVTFSILKHHLFNSKVIATEMFVGILTIILLIRFIISSSNQDYLANGLVFLSVCAIGFILVKSVIKEVRTREEVEKLAHSLEKSNKELEMANQTKSKFLSIASHQFRSPLTAIRGYTSLLIDGGYGELPKEAQEPFDRILKSTASLSLVVDDFLNLSRIEQGRMDYNFEEKDLKEFLEGVVDEQEAVVQRQGSLTLNFYTRGSGPFLASIDEGKLKQVATNLVDNAIKYTKQGSIEVHLERDDEKRVFRFWTKDTGLGISKETLPKLFTQFSRADNANTVNVMGTGLGLYIAREIVKAHGGNIWAESEGDGKGSRFIVELPIDPSGKRG